MKFSIISLSILFTSSDALRGQAAPRQEVVGDGVSNSINSFVDKNNIQDEERKNTYITKSTNRKLQDEEEEDDREPCLDSWTLWTEDGCDIDVLVDELDLILDEAGCRHNAKQEFRLITGLDSFGQARKAVREACMNNVEANSVPFDKFGDDNDVFTKAFFDGDTYFNYERETINNDGETVYNLENGPAGQLIKTAYEKIAQVAQIDWPGERRAVDNFDDCEIRAAMCCWVQDRQANDNNGNCRESYDRRCSDSDPADNTDICYVDMERAPSSSRTPGGFALFPDESEGDAHCHGFAWHDDDWEPSSLFKGNNLFYVSLYDHLYQRGYVRNVPGAPMCGCVEQMPVVTRSDCTEIVMESFWTKFEYAANGGMFASDTGSVVRVTAHPKIEFQACVGRERNNDLESYFDRLLDEEVVTDIEREILGETIVGEGNCNGAIKDFIATRNI